MNKQMNFPHKHALNRWPSHEDGWIDERSNDQMNAN